MKTKKILVAFLVGALLVASLAGCSGGGSQVATEASPVIYNGEDIYPMQCEDTLEYWTSFTGGGLLSGSTTLADAPMGKGLIEQTGAKLVFMHPQKGQEAEQFNILLAGDELPDVIEYSWFAYSGGPDKAIADNYIISLDDIWDKFLPNISAYAKEHPDIDKEIKTDEGHYFTVPGLSQLKTATSGLLFRKDLLDKAGLAVPETIDEWTATMKALKEAYPDKEVFLMHPQARTQFMVAYGIGGRDFYLDGDTVKYGSNQPSYKDFLLKMKEWYDAGYFDKNMPSIDNTQVVADMINGDAIACQGWVGSSIGNFINSNKIEGYDIVAAPYPVLKKGDKPEYGAASAKVELNNRPAITTQCVNVELAARVMDYGYTEAGHMLYNFGIEGESYEMIDGYPTLTDLILHNPDGISVINASGSYCRAATSGPMITDARFYEQYYEHPQQLAATKIWETNGQAHLLPTTYISGAEADEYAEIMANVQTYINESFISFVLGSMSIEDQFDDYIKQLDEFGIQRAIEIKQNAYNKYLAR